MRFNNKQIIALIFFIGIVNSFFCFSQERANDIFWNEYNILRDHVYNNDVSLVQLVNLYQKAKQLAYDILDESELMVALSRCEYIMGRAYSYASDKKNASTHYDVGMDYAETASEIKDSPKARLIYLENLSQNCSVKPTSFVLAYGPKIAGLAKKILKQDPTCGAAMFILNAQHIFAPIPFNNYKKGIKEMQAILKTPNIVLEKDDSFNIFCAIAYAYLKQDEKSKALPYLEKAKNIYPTNVFLKELLTQSEN
ncbi:MAG: hypothetical protein J6B81_02115 [Spirochaetaceae bacterium]|nr:hypothetical protein [Spirochaetaceae bacterium]